MDSPLIYLNKNFCFGKVDKKWKVCKLTGSSVYDAEKDVRVCSRNDKKNWKRFTEAMRYTSEFSHNIGDPVMVEEDGIQQRYFVIDAGFEVDGQTGYIIGR